MAFNEYSANIDIEQKHKNSEKVINKAAFEAFSGKPSVEKSKKLIWLTDEVKEINQENNRHSINCLQNKNLEHQREYRIKNPRTFINA